jgi:hypothetical protein
LWVHGPAGSGKSTLATTFAEAFSATGHLGAFVFCSRDVEERSRPAAIFRTIAYHLAIHDKGLCQQILAVIRQDPRVADLRMDVQFEKLISGPFLASDSSTKPVIIMMDALDELLPGDERQKFFSVLGDGLKRLPEYVRVIISSRKDHDIHRHLAHLENVKQYDLSQIPSADSDIRRYFLERLKDIHEISGAHHLASSTAEVIEQLVANAHGLFLWASLACSYITEYNPQDRIQTITQHRDRRVEAETPLDRLYSTAIQSAGVWDTRDFSKNAQDFFSIVVVALNPQSAQSISEITCIRADVVAEIVLRFQSILQCVPDGPIQFLHPSVPEYLSNSERCQEIWFVDRTQAHFSAAMHCIRLLSRSLKNNMKNLKLSDAYQASGPWVGHLLLITENLPEGMTYAASTWIHHVCSVEDPASLQDLIASVHEFLCLHFFRWLEALSILGLSRNSILYLKRLKDWYNNFSPVSFHFSNLMVFRIT